MRRPIGLILIGLGTFFLALAPLVRFYVADQVVTAPLNRYQVTRLEATNAAYFDAATLTLKNGASLAAINTIRGDVRANAGNDDVAVWDSTTSVYDKADPSKPIQIQGYRIAFDRRTAKLVNCCSINVDGDNTVKMSGYGLLFPIADVQKRDYPFFDMTTRQSTPMQFNGVEKVAGLTAYRFTQHVPLTKTAALDTKLPGKLLGLGGKSKDQKVDRYSELHNTVWVDPRTGIPIKYRQNVRNTVQTPDGKGKMIVALADFVTVPKDQKGSVDTANSSAFRIDLVREYIPAAAVFGGLILLLVGGIFSFRRGTPPPPQAPRRSDGRFGTAKPSDPPQAPT